MWKLLAPGLLLLAMIVAVIAGDRPPAPAEFTYSENTSIITLDPQRISYTHDMRVNYCLFEGLLRWDNTTFIPQPAVASAWEQSEDGATYTFHLREDAKWSNGDPVVASDFIFAWRRLLLPDTAADYTALFFVIDGAEAFFNWRSEQLSAYATLPPAERTQQAADDLWARTIERFNETVGLSATDDRTLVVTLERPTAYFLDLVCFAIAHPVHPETVERWASIDPQTGRLNQRLSMLDVIETGFIGSKRGDSPKAHQEIYQKAVNLMTSKQMEAFKVEDEDPALLEKYSGSASQTGMMMRNAGGFGRSLLMARRLVETRNEGEDSSPHVAAAPSPEPHACPAVQRPFQPRIAGGSRDDPGPRI